MEIKSVAAERTFFKDVWVPILDISQVKIFTIMMTTLFSVALVRLEHTHYIACTRHLQIRIRRRIVENLNYTSAHTNEVAPLIHSSLFTGIVCLNYVGRHDVLFPRKNNKYSEVYSSHVTLKRMKRWTFQSADRFIVDVYHSVRGSVLKITNLYLGYDIATWGMVGSRLCQWDGRQ